MSSARHSCTHQQQQGLPGPCSRCEQHPRASNALLAHVGAGQVTPGHDQPYNAQDEASMRQYARERRIPVQAECTAFGTIAHQQPRSWKAWGNDCTVVEGLLGASLQQPNQHPYPLTIVVPPNACGSAMQGPRLNAQSSFQAHGNDLANGDSQTRGQGSISSSRQRCGAPALHHSSLQRGSDSSNGTAGGSSSVVRSGVRSIQATADVNAQSVSDDDSSDDEGGDSDDDVDDSDECDDSEADDDA